MTKLRTTRLLFILLSLVAAYGAAGEMKQFNAPCTAETCPGLAAFAGPAALLEQIRIEKGSAMLAFHLGLSLLDEDCCFTDAVGYLSYALRTQPRLAPGFYAAMNNARRNSAGRYARAILAVSARVKNL